jgi:hypothetical protein
MCNVEIIVEQPQCASVYKEPALISEQPLTRIDIAHLSRDPSNRPQIWEYLVNQQDEIRRTYINLGPYQPLKEIAERFTIDMIIDDLYSMKERRTQLK